MGNLKGSMIKKVKCDSLVKGSLLILQRDKTRYKGKGTCSEVQTIGHKVYGANGEN